MPHEKILLSPPDYADPKVGEAAAKLWVPQGLMVQWGPYGETDGAPAVGIGTGHMAEDTESMDRVNSGGGKLEDMYMMWFNRSYINRIIRTLRRARTAAYGADE